MEFKDYYQILGVAPDTDEKTIKSAYRRMARKYHPDVSKEPGAEEKFKAANEAHEVLSDPERRAEYDRIRAGGYRPGDPFPPNWGGTAQGGGFEGFGDSGFSDFFESLFGRGRGRGRGRTARGGAAHAPPEVRAHLDIDLETAFAGGTQRVEVNGRTLEIKIPAGIAPGRSIRLKGQGGQGRDLLIEIGYRPHPTFELEGRHVIVRRRIEPWLAALGGSIDVPTLAGRVKLAIPPGSDTGRRLRLRGRGMPGSASAAAGDQFVLLEIAAPRPATEAQRQAYRELAASFGVELAEPSSD